MRRDNMHMTKKALGMAVSDYAGGDVGRFRWTVEMNSQNKSDH